MKACSHARPNPLGCFEESLYRSGVVSRAGVSERMELGWVLTLGECTLMVFLGKMMSCKHVFIPDNILMYLSITVHTHRFIFFP